VFQDHKKGVYDQPKSETSDWFLTDSDIAQSQKLKTTKYAVLEKPLIVCDKSYRFGISGSL